MTKQKPQSTKKTNRLEKIEISLASPDQIRSWSQGEVTSPNTLHYRTLLPETGGLFCSVIFGTTRDYECLCGALKGYNHRGKTCDECHVKVEHSGARRERMGHIELACPVAHPWYAYLKPSVIGDLLGIKQKDLEAVLNYASYIITSYDANAIAALRLDIEKAEGMLSDSATEGLQVAAEAAIEETTTASQMEERARAEHNERIGAIRAQTQIRIRAIRAWAEEIEPWGNERIGKKTIEDLCDPEDNVVLEAGCVLTGETTEIIARHVNEFEAAIKEDVFAQIVSMEKKFTQTRVSLEAAAERAKDNLTAVLRQTPDWLAGAKKILDELAPGAAVDPQVWAAYPEIAQHIKTSTGAPAIQALLRNVDLNKESENIRAQLQDEDVTPGMTKKLRRKLKIVESFRRSGNRPEWMVMEALPVIPPDLRPILVMQDGGIAASDLNEYYRKIVARNNRIKMLEENSAPEIILNVERRSLQRSIKALFSGGGKTPAGKELKSIYDMLKGKRGRFRQNLLGKRVDYSGRSVIVTGPKLKINQCGLPRGMAMRMFRPFVIAELITRGKASNKREAKKLVDERSLDAYAALEAVVKTRPVILNRAPSLHRLSMQAFEVVLVDGDAILVHPLVTPPFNADFDGDQMAVHLPVTGVAAQEVRAIMMSTKNMLSPSNGDPTISPSKDMVLGLYYLTMPRESQRKNEMPYFANVDEIELAIFHGKLSPHDPIFFRTATWYQNGKRMKSSAVDMIQTTAGRAIFNSVLPPEVQFVNETVGKKDIKAILAEAFTYCAYAGMAKVADKIKELGFYWASKSGISLVMGDVVIPPEKQALIEEGEQSIRNIERSRDRGLMTPEEAENAAIEVWQDINKRLGEAVKKAMPPRGNMVVMANSGGSKGGFNPISQLAGMRGLMVDPSGRVIPVPIKSGLLQGLTVLEYFIGSHGARKGLADTALRTADAGYLTRRLVDVAQDVIVNDVDCGTQDGWLISVKDEYGKQSFAQRLYGRTIARQILHPESNRIIAERNDLLTHDLIEAIQEAGVQEVLTRSPLKCDLQFGICSACYGMNMATMDFVTLGTPVGVIAAQSIGEPGTQLTLRTFHSGGVAGADGDITTGLPRVEQLLEARSTMKTIATLAPISGVVSIEQQSEGDVVIRLSDTLSHSETHVVPPGWEVKVQDGQTVTTGECMAAMEEAEIKAALSGSVSITERNITIQSDEEVEANVAVPPVARLLVQNGARVEKGAPLTDGTINPHDVLEILGEDVCATYIIAGIQAIYTSQGQDICDKHFEIVVRKMLEKMVVVDSGDSMLVPGDLVNKRSLERTNQALFEKGRKAVEAEPILLGITGASLNGDSWLSTASFQNTSRVLTMSAIASDQDPLRDIKASVILGRPIPAGTGFRGRRTS